MPRSDEYRLPLIDVIRKTESFSAIDHKSIDSRSTGNPPGSALDLPFQMDSQLAA
jgi:hypothetical protein